MVLGKICFKGNMAKFSFNGRSEVYLEYPGLFDIMRFCQLQGLNGLAAFYHEKEETLSHK